MNHTVFMQHNLVNVFVQQRVVQQSMRVVEPDLVGDEADGQVEHQLEQITSAV